MLRGYYRSLAAYLSVGFSVIADLGLYTENISQIFREETAILRPLLVGVHCGVEELDRREKARGNRPIGLGRTQAGFIHRSEDYGVEVDTTDGDLARCATEIREAGSRR